MRIQPDDPEAARLQIYEKIPGFETKSDGFFSKPQAFRLSYCFKNKASGRSEYIPRF